MKSRRNRGKASSKETSSERTAAQMKYEETMVTMHLPLVRAVVNRIAKTLPAHVCSEDLHSAGLVGLYSAVRGYNPKFGATFETYAKVRIRGAIFDELRSMDWVPRSVHAKARKVEEARQKLEQLKSAEPTSSEMAQELRLSLADYATLLNEIKPVTFIHLDFEYDSDGDKQASRYEHFLDEGQADPCQSAMISDMAHLVASRLQTLPHAERRVVVLYYFEDLRGSEISELLGLSEARICQIHAKAILSLRQALPAEAGTAA